MSEVKDCVYFENAVTFCAFCENEAEYIIDNTDTPICPACKQVFVAGQGNPSGCLKEIPIKEE